MRSCLLRETAERQATRRKLLRTEFCDLFGVEAPILQAAIWPATSPELVAAVSNAGGMGSLGTVFETADVVRTNIGRIRDLTARPFVVNHVVPQLDDKAFEATLEAQPAAVSLALGSPGSLVERVHSAGAKVIHQVHTVEQAREAAGLGVDVLIAQGSEAGGQGLSAGVGVMALVPQVVDAVGRLPVLAAGGIADGRGLGAALVLGAAGVNVGTRFLASEEAAADDEWKRRIVEIESEDAVRFDAWSSIMPPRPGSYAVVPRVIRTDFVTEWSARPDAARASADDLRGQILATLGEGHPHKLTPFTGQSAGLVHEVRPAAEIISDMVAKAESALANVPAE